MKTMRVVIISLCVICWIGWSLSVIAVKYDPLVFEAQKRLAELGYNIGTVDGKMEQKTIEAIKQFQHDQGLAVTGKLDEETLQKLGVSFTPKQTRPPETTRGNIRLEIKEISLGEALPDIRDIRWSSFIVSPDSQWVAYAAARDSKWFVVVDGKEGQIYDSFVSPLTFDSPTSFHMFTRRNMEIFRVEGAIMEE